MKKVINENDIKKASNMERCQIILAIVKRTSYIHAGYKNTLAENIDLETCKIKRKLKECWGIDKF